MTISRAATICFTFLSYGTMASAAEDTPASATIYYEKWSPTAAAQYMDARAAWWESWPKAQRDHGTVCVSCHTVLPYVLSRSLLRNTLAETEMTAPQTSMLGYVKKRVSEWSEMLPYYSDEKYGTGKAKESRATESVLNALVLASEARNEKHLDSLTRSAFDAAWELQIKSGDKAGAWQWQLFKLSPWEAGESQYEGAAWMALASGWAPDNYRKDPRIQPNIRLLRSYLTKEYSSQPLLNKVVLLWASSRFPELLSSKQKHELVAELLELQRPDGGWNLASLGSWQRSDKTPEEVESDAYATGLIAVAFKQAHIRHQEGWTKARAWIETHQNRQDGSWHTASLNKDRDLSTDTGKFMTDAATGFAIMALESSR